MRGFFTMMGGLRHLCDEKFLIMGGLEGQKMQPIILFITMRRNDIHHNVVTIYSFFFPTSGIRRRMRILMPQLLDRKCTFDFCTFLLSRFRASSSPNYFRTSRSGPSVLRVSFVLLITDQSKSSVGNSPSNAMTP